MTDLQTLFHAVNDLNADEIDQLQQYLEKRRLALSHSEVDIEAKIAALEAGLAKFREGLTSEEWEPVAHAMNAEYLHPADGPMYDWMDNHPEDER